jgi:nucleoside 2-deoxyribosyltransferase
MRVYLAGPMSGLPDFNYPAFHDGAKALRNAGYDVVSPAEVNPETDQEWAYYMRRDIPELLTCDGVVVLPGWENSKGASLEVHIARALDMPIRDIAVVESRPMTVTTDGDGWVRSIEDAPEDWDLEGQPEFNGAFRG